MSIMPIEIDCMWGPSAVVSMHDGLGSRRGKPLAGDIKMQLHIHPPQNADFNSAQKREKTNDKGP